MRVLIERKIYMILFYKLYNAIHIVIIPFSILADFNGITCFQVIINKRLLRISSKHIQIRIGKCCTITLYNIFNRYTEPLGTT